MPNVPLCFSMLTGLQHEHAKDDSASERPRLAASEIEVPSCNGGMSLSDYLVREIREIADRPTLQEFQQQLERREPVKLPVPAADIIRAERDSR
jgi:hypothetical protein